MAILNYHKNCRVCGNNLIPIISLGNHYLHGSFVYKDFQPPTRKFPVELVRCDAQNGGCGLVQLKHSIDPDILYSRYGYVSSTTYIMKNHLSSIVNDILRLIPTDFPDKLDKQERFLDIGANDLYLLKQYPKHFGKVGIDPCDIINKSYNGESDIRIINDLFPCNTLFHKYDVITMINCFYDLNDPVNCAQKINNYLNSLGIAVIEVSYWPEKMLKGAIDECVMEHVCYYNYQNLEYIFNQAELKIFNAKLNNINGGDIQIWLCNKNVDIYDNPEFKQNILDIKFKEANLALDTNKPYCDFKLKCSKLKKEVKDLFNAIKNDNKIVHLLGSSTKGNVLLQYLELDKNDIPYASERSKEKWDAKTLGTDIQIISEEESRKMKPDYYFVPIWAFKKEIIEREQEYLKNGGKLIFPLPELEII